MKKTFLQGQYMDNIKIFSRDREVTLFDRVGFLCELQFPPTLHYKSPKIFSWANNVQVLQSFVFEKCRRAVHNSPWVCQES
jgi:hypothetical protein